MGDAMFDLSIGNVGNEPRHYPCRHLCDPTTARAFHAGEWLEVIVGGNLRALSCWFGLSYASWLTMPRVLMEAMPDDWQGRMAALLKEYQRTFPNQPDLGTTVRVTYGGKLVPTPGWLVQYRRPDRAAVDACRAQNGGRS